MIKIRTDDDGKPLAWGTEIQGGTDFAGELPEDFDATAGLGKYTFQGGAIVETPDWTPPVLVPEPSIEEPEPEPESEPESEPEPEAPAEEPPVE